MEASIHNGLAPDGRERIDSETGRRLAGALFGTRTTPGLPDIADYSVKRALSGGPHPLYAARLPGCLREYVIHVVDGCESTTALENLLVRLARFRHPGVARLFEFGHQGGSLYVVFEAVAGSGLDAYCRNLKVRNDDRIALLARIADIVQNMHEFGVAHGGLHPRSVVINASGDPMLVNAGVSALPGRSESQRSITGLRRPEEGGPASSFTGLRGRDIRGLGLIANAILRAPGDEGGDHGPATVVEPLAWGPPVLRDEHPSLSAIIARALATPATNHFATAAALARELRYRLDDRGIESIGA